MTFQCQWSERPSRGEGDESIGFSFMVQMAAQGCSARCLYTACARLLDPVSAPRQWYIWIDGFRGVEFEGNEAAMRCHVMRAAIETLQGAAVCVQSDMMDQVEAAAVRMDSDFERLDSEFARLRTAAQEVAEQKRLAQQTMAEAEAKPLWRRMLGT